MWNLQRHPKRFRLTPHEAVKTFLTAELLALLNAASLMAESTTNTIARTSGVSISFIGFTNTGTPRNLIATFGPTTNRAPFGLGTPTIPLTNFIVRYPFGSGAMFQFTNTSPNATVCTVASMEYNTNGVWKMGPPQAETTMVPPNSAVFRTLPVNDTNVAWRISVFCVERATGVPRAIERGKELGVEAITGQKTDHFSGRKYVTTSLPSMTQ